MPRGRPHPRTRRRTPGAKRNLPDIAVRRGPLRRLRPDRSLIGNLPPCERREPPRAGTRIPPARSGMRSGRSPRIRRLESDPSTGSPLRLPHRHRRTSRRPDRRRPSRPSSPRNRLSRRGRERAKRKGSPSSTAPRVLPAACRKECGQTLSRRGCLRTQIGRKASGHGQIFDFPSRSNAGTSLTLRSLGCWSQLCHC